MAEALTACLRSARFDLIGEFRQAIPAPHAQGSCSYLRFPMGLGRRGRRRRLVDACWRLHARIILTTPPLTARRCWSSAAGNVEGSGFEPTFEGRLNRESPWWDDHDLACAAAIYDWLEHLYRARSVGVSRHVRCWRRRPFWHSMVAFVTNGRLVACRRSCQSA